MTATKEFTEKELEEIRKKTKEKKRRQKETINALIARDGDKCQLYFCKNPWDWSDPENFRTIEHVHPKAKGGTDDMDNLVLAHFKCNNKKGDRLYLPDGTLEILPGREPKIKVKKRPPTECCNEGRDLGENEVCEICGLNPMPYTFPRWAKMSPKDCSHSGVFWCWACSIGIYERQSAAYDVFGE